MAIPAYPPETPTASIRRAVVTSYAAAQAVLPARPCLKAHWRVSASRRPIRRVWPSVTFRCDAVMRDVSRGSTWRCAWNAAVNMRLIVFSLIALVCVMPVWAGERADRSGTPDPAGLGD